MAHELIFYKTPEGEQCIEVVYEDENFWMTQRPTGKISNGADSRLETDCVKRDCYPARGDPISPVAMIRSQTHLLRILALTEGVSFLLLLGIAMPLKYLAGLPMLVKVFGWGHGALFVALCLLLLKVTLEERWPLTRSGMVFVAALLPFGPFLIDHRLKKL